jgi:hypothetical protein
MGVKEFQTTLQDQ